MEAREVAGVSAGPPPHVDLKWSWRASCGATRGRIGERWGRSAGSDAARATELGNAEGVELMLERGGKAMVLPALDGDGGSAPRFSLSETGGALCPLELA